MRKYNSNGARANFKELVLVFIPILVRALEIGGDIAKKRGQLEKGSEGS